MRYLTWLLLAGSFIGAGAQTKKQCAALQPCPDGGCGPRRDSALNAQKNRATPPAHFQVLSYSQFVALNKKSVNHKFRKTWTDPEKKRVEDVENGDGITLVANFIDATKSDAETCNCFGPDEGRRDFHIWLAENASGAKQKKFIVVEMTPKVRASQPNWTLKRLASLKPKAGQPMTTVRVRGYALFDNEHWDFPKRKPRIRATAWEIHPVIEFDVCPKGQTCTAESTNWVKLSDME